MPRDTGICLVLWSGQTGGAETFTAALASSMRRQGADARVLFVTRGAGLTSILDENEVPWGELGLRNGSRVLGQPRRLSREVSFLGPSIAFVPAVGYLPAALRVGGYRAPIVAVEHNGALVDAGRAGRAWRATRIREETLGLWSLQAQVAVSDAVRDSLERRRHARRLLTIPNGVDTDRFSAQPGSSAMDRSRPLRLAAAGRLVEGKGFGRLIEACEPLFAQGRVELRIAGDGPDRSRLEDVVRDAGMAPEECLRGTVTDMPSFWRSCDVAVVPSHGLVESFGMVAAEAMACGKPVIATRQPGLAAVVEDGRTGTLVEPGDVRELRAAIERYESDRELLETDGSRARARAVSHFSVDVSAQQYLRLVSDLTAARKDN